MYLNNNNNKVKPLQKSLTNRLVNINNGDSSTSIKKSKGVKYSFNISRYLNYHGHFV